MLQGRSASNIETAGRRTDAPFTMRPVAADPNPTDNAARLAAELARTRHELARAELRFRSAFGHQFQFMAILAPDKQWAEVNPQLCKMLHYSEDELLRKSWFEVTHPDDRATEETNFNHLLEGIQGGYSLEKRFLAHDGQTIWAKVSLKCLRLENGEIDSIIALVHQIDHKA